MLQPLSYVRQDKVFAILRKQLDEAAEGLHKVSTQLGHAAQDQPRPSHLRALSPPPPPE